MSDTTDPFNAKGWSSLAQLVLTRSLGLGRGKTVIINTFQHTLRFAEVLAMEARKLGIQPVTLYSAGASIARVGRANGHARNPFAPPELATIAACDGYIWLTAPPEDFRRPEQHTPARLRAFARYDEQVHTILARNSIPAIYLMATAPTEKAADEYGLDRAAWTREALRGSSVDPRTLQRIARPLARRLGKGRTATITHSNGTRLELGLVGRKPVLNDGRVDQRDLRDGNVWSVVPAGLLCVAVDERVAEGRIVANRPSQYPQGAVLDSDWTFRRGRLDRYSAGSGRAIFEGAYRRGGRERSRPGMLTIGVNPELRDFPRAEDQAQGVVSVHIGHNDDFGGRSRGKFRAYAILEGADLLVDDEPVLRSGREV
jgi:leucyl aminopeptidase (aminopeptidase T)